MQVGDIDVEFDSGRIRWLIEMMLKTGVPNGDRRTARTGGKTALASHWWAGNYQPSPRCRNQRLVALSSLHSSMVLVSYKQEIQRTISYSVDNS